MKVFPSVLFIVVMAAVSNTAVGQLWDMDGQIATFDDDENIIKSGVTLSPTSGNNQIVVNSLVVHIENSGTIDANINANGNTVYLQNAGDITGSVIGCTDRICVTQVITSDAELKNLDITGLGFYADVHDFNNVDFLKLRDLHPSEYRLENVMIVVDDYADWQNWGAGVVHWNGANTLCVTDSRTLKSGRVKNVSVDTNLNILSLDENRLYRIDFVHDDIGIMLNVVRETDYQRIFSDGRGVFLDGMRLSNPGDKMLMAMDAATNMDELQGIMNSSYRFNPGVLMKPVKSVNNFVMMDGLLDDDGRDVGFVPFYITSNNVHDVGGRVYLNADYGDYYFNVGLHLDKFSYEDSINDFGGVIYGANLNLKRKLNDFSIIGRAGVDLIDFEADNIYTVNEIKNNPFGYALYGGIEGVDDFRIFENLVLSPFVGGTFQQFNVMDFSENDINLHGGGKVKYHFVVDGIRYEYGALCGITTDGNVFGNFKVGFDSLSDDAGIILNVGAYDEEDLVSYRVSVNAHISF